MINASPGARIREVVRPAIRLIRRRLINLEPLISHVVDLVEYVDLLERVTTEREPGYIKGVVRLQV